MQTAPVTTDDPLKLLAFDSEDLAVLSTHLQDAVIKVGDMVYAPQDHRFAFAGNRFDWVAAVEGGCDRRRRAAVHFDHVQSVKCKGIDRKQPNQVLCLLAVAFEETDSPAGCVTLAFAGGASIRLEVECIEACLSDLGPMWATTCRPKHAEDAEIA